MDNFLTLSCIDILLDKIAKYLNEDTKTELNIFDVLMVQTLLEEYKDILLISNGKDN